MKVLVVDDERDVQVLFEQRFRRETREHKIELAFTFSGEEALHYLNHRGQEAVLILSDINLPGMSGLELLDKIKHNNYMPPPRVMMITAYGSPNFYEKAMELGADDFLTKPLDFNLLREKLNTLN
jgi:two-component system, chemotaxis family, chemotaxis protein CheY